MPKSDFLDGCGYLWEAALLSRDWNNLPSEQKRGYITQVYVDYSCDVFFPALRCTVTGVYLDELKPVGIAETPSPFCAAPELLALLEEHRD